MIEAVYELGKIYERSSKKSPLEEMIDNPNITGNYNNVLILKFTVTDKKVSYTGIETDEFTVKKLRKYLYSKGSSRGGDNTPTTLISNPDDPLKKLLQPVAKLETETFRILHTFLSVQKNYKKINSDIKALLKPKSGYILTVNINNQWMGDYKECIKKVQTQKVKNFYHLESIGTSRAENKQCFICKNKQERIYGFVNTYNFYTVDKKGFVPGGFKQTESWKNYPVCQDCAFTLEKGKKYLSAHYSGKFAQSTYFVIPALVFKYGSETDIELLEELLNELEDKHRISLTEGRKTELIGDEIITFSAMKEMENRIVYYIMFYKEDNNAFRILCNIEDILPSRLRQIFSAKKKVETHAVFETIKIKDKDVYFLFNFRIIRDYFPSGFKSYLEIIRNIFMDIKIDYHFMLTHIIDVLRKRFINNGYMEIITKNSLLIIKFLIFMDLFRNREETNVKTKIEKDEKSKIYLDFLEEHGEVYNSDEKRGIFLLGVLIKKLLNIQYKKNKSTPFYARLNGLHINTKIIHRLLPEAINKLEEYDKNYYIVLEDLISSYFSHSQFNSLSNDEISYYFALGMSLAKHFKTQEEDKDNKEE